MSTPVLESISTWDNRAREGTEKLFVETPSLILCSPQVFHLIQYDRDCSCFSLVTSVPAV